jgi:hypothetical protein
MGAGGSGMRSPFSGVDPFVEDQGLWPDLHHTFITFWRAAINRILPPGYVARVDDRFEIIERPNQSLAQRLPDVSIEHVGTTTAPAYPAATGVPAGAVLLEPVPIPLTIETEHREAFIEIVRLPGNRLVSVLELLSPTNKSGIGYRGYLNKRNEVLLNDVSLVEVDLLIEGERIPLERPLPDGHYYTFISRVSRRPWCDVLAWNVSQRMPAIPIPLLPEHGEVWVDLQAIFDEAFASAGFDRELDYQRPLSLPFDQQALDWIHGIVPAAR